MLSGCCGSDPSLPPSVSCMRSNLGNRMLKCTLCDPHLMTVTQDWEPAVTLKLIDTSFNTQTNTMQQLNPIYYCFVTLVKVSNVCYTPFKLNMP